MGLNRKQLKYILDNKDKASPEKISETINIPIDQIKSIIDRSSKKFPFYFYIVLVLIPLLFFVLLETGLRIFNYGYDSKMWVNVTEDYLIINPDVAKRYFSSIKSVPSSIEDTFREEKTENTFRVFVLGGSSAAGHPYMPMGSFSRYIRRRLELAYPNSTIEVINLSLSATNTYTLRDFIPEVLSQKPDLILIYSGHNEYYGALGVGSLESVSSSREMVIFFLFLNKFKTTQLVKDFLQWVSTSVLSSEEQMRTGTLMSRMAENKSIALNSEKYYAGIEQFEGNMSDILEMIKKANVPVIISTLASNLKDQYPFISIKNGQVQPADKIFQEATNEYNKYNYKKADSLFRLAKDLDGLRFRAPEKINSIIKQLSKKYHVPLIDADSLFASISPNNITGNNLMTDHLHPTLNGYHEIGKLFYNKMNEMKYLPHNSEPVIPIDEQDIITRNEFVFSEFDSITAEYRIKLLKNDWPFIDPKFKKNYYEVCLPKTHIDSLSVKFLTGNIGWDEAIQNCANWYFRHKNINGFLDHMHTLIYQYPIIVEYQQKMEEIAADFIKIQDYNSAKKILTVIYKLTGSSFSAKWLGNIELNNGFIKSALSYLEEAARKDSNDLQIFYNLAGAYSLDKQYRKGYETIVKKVLRKNKDYPGARELALQLEKIMDLR